MILVLFQTALPAGGGSALKDVANVCLPPVRAARDGTLFYEWFLNDESGHGALVEAYDSEPAFLAHLGLLREAKTPPPPGTNPTLVILGDLGEKMQGSVARWPGTTYFGPQIYGVIDKRGDALVAGEIGDAAIFTSARFTVPDHLREEFLTFLPGLVARVAKDEPGTLAYEWFAGDGELRVFEIYRDEAARRAHFDNADPTLRAFLGKIDVEAVYYGAMAPDTIAAATALPGRSYGGPRIGGLA